MTDPVPDAGDDKTNQQADAEASPVAESPPAAQASTTESAADEQGIDKPAGGNDGTSEAAETEEPDSDEDEEEEDEEEDDDDDNDDGDDEEEDEDDEDEEPRLKYARLTQNLAGVYKNADATSSFLVAGDKMVRIFAACFDLRAQVLLTSGTDRWHPQRQHQCHTASSFPGPPSIPRPLRFRDDSLDLPLSAAIQHWQTRSCPTGDFSSHGYYSRRAVIKTRISSVRYHASCKCQKATRSASNSEHTVQ